MSVEASTPSPPVVGIVDDDPAVGRALGRLVRSAGLFAESFQSAEEYLARREETAAAVLVIDVMMPDVGGFELLDRLRALGSTIPVIFISGLSDDRVGARATRADAAFFQKPVDEDDLLTAIRDAVGEESFD